MSIKPFIFGGNTGHSYEDIKRLRAQADSMQPMKPISGGVAGYGQGLSAIGHAIAQRVMNNKADKLEAEGRQKFQTRFNKWTHMAANPATAPASQTAEGGQKPRAFRFDPSVLEMAASPHATPGQKLLMQLIVQKQIDSNDELKQLSIARQRLELEKAQNPERKILTGADGYQYYQDDASRVLPGVEKPQPARYQMLAPEQTQQLGLPEGAYQQGPKGRISQVGGGGTHVNVTTPAESQLQKERGRGLGGRLNTLAEDGMKALDDLNTFKRFGTLLNQADTGPTTQVRELVSRVTGDSLGLDDNVGVLQAAEAMVRYMAPRMRPVGSGTVSDADIEMFVGSLPALRKTPEGNRQILETLMGMAQHRADIGELAVQWQLGELTAGEMHKRMRALPDPFAAFSRREPDDAGWTPMGDGVRIRRKQP